MHDGCFDMDAFAEQATAFHGYPAPGLLLGGRMVELAKARLPEGILYDAYSETGHCLPDAIQLLTPCTLGNGWLRVLPFGVYALCLYDKQNGDGVRVVLDGDRLDPWPAIRSWFRKEFPKKEQDSARLQEEIRTADNSIFRIAPVRVRSDRLGPRSFGPVAPCPLCGAWYPAAFGRLCRACQGESPYAQGPWTASAAPVPPTRVPPPPSWLAPPASSSGTSTPPAGTPAPVAIPVAEAVGKHALHDMTRIIPGEEKGAAFVRGQEITAGDVCRLQQMGRFPVYVSEDTAVHGAVHEDEAAGHFARLMPGEGVEAEGPPREGKVNFRATRPGLLVVDSARLERFNLIPDLMCATRHGCSVVNQDARVAGSRAIPLFLPREGLNAALALLEAGPLFAVRPLRAARVGILVTGTEVFQGLIQDRFAPLVIQKVRNLGCSVTQSRIVPDDKTAIVIALQTLLDAGSDLIVTTAGLSVDPDDVTRKALLDAGLQDVLYGLPVLPGTMTLAGRLGPAQVLGVPACALYFKITAFDLLLPRLLAGVPITRDDLARLGEGGLCLECKTCTFPKCAFGRS